MQELIIRPQSIADVDELYRLENEIFDCEIVSPRSFRNFARSPSIASAVLENGKGLAGYATVFFRSNSKTARIYSIALRPEYQSSGLGKRLLDHCVQLASSRGCDSLKLEVKIDNHRAIAFYEKQGFQRRGIRERFYQDGTDALLLSKPL